ncbi:MAG TPA: beta-ketoacyl-[acyl-carrier-protein] synthase family protein [Clostridia bacterium]
MSGNRVVITGIGVISPIGVGGKAFWESAVKGVCGIGEIKAFDTSKFKNHYGAEVKDFEPENYICSDKMHKMGRASQFAIAASKMAIEDSGLDLKSVNSKRIGVSLGTTMGEIQIEEKISETWVKHGLQEVDSSEFIKYPSGCIPRNVAAEFNFNGPAMMIPTACAAGNYAIGYAFDLLRQGKVDAMVAGGVDPFSRMAFTGFHRLRSIAPSICQPFDLNRKGIIVGEGAGILLMETLDNALKRGANIYAEVLGYGLGCDAHHMTAPHPEGLGGIRAIQAALKCARISSDDIQYVSAHGTGTKENDRIETKIIKSVFKDRAKQVPMSSLKSMIGHTMGAASAIEAVLCTYIVNNDIITPTINYQEPDPECDLDYVPNAAREHKVNIALSNAYAFGGNDAALLIGKFN